MQKNNNTDNNNYKTKINKIPLIEVTKSHEKMEQPPPKEYTPPPPLIGQPPEN